MRLYEPLVRRIVRGLRLPPWCEPEDLAQEARIGLLAAVREWQPERGPFAAFADRCVTNQALLALEAAGRHKHQVLSLAVSLDGTGVQALSVTSDARTDPELRLLVREQLKSLIQTIPALTERERAALAAALNGHGYAPAQAEHGRASKAASQAAYRARRKLAAALRPAA